jgi:hypothetical protein
MPYAAYLPLDPAQARKELLLGGRVAVLAGRGRSHCGSFRGSSEMTQPVPQGGIQPFEVVLARLRAASTRRLRFPER